MPYTLYPISPIPLLFIILFSIFVPSKIIIQTINMENSNVKTGHPKGLYLLYFTEMWERLSYYGMRSIFMLYMVNALLFDKEFASKIYGSYIGLVYLTPLLGGYISDHFWGNRRSIITGGILMALGQFFMFLSGWY